MNSCPSKFHLRKDDCMPYSTFEDSRKYLAHHTIQHFVAYSFGRVWPSFDAQINVEEISGGSRISRGVLILDATCVKIKESEPLGRRLVPKAPLDLSSFIFWSVIFLMYAFKWSPKNSFLNHFVFGSWQLQIAVYKTDLWWCMGIPVNPKF